MLNISFHFHLIIFLFLTAVSLSQNTVSSYLNWHQTVLLDDIVCFIVDNTFENYSLMNTSFPGRNINCKDAINNRSDPLEESMLGN